MRTRVWTNSAALRLALVLFAAPSLTAVTLSAQDPVFDAPGIQRHREYFSQVSFEDVDTLTGSLVLTFTDLVLPGNAGSELRFVRTYNSKNSLWTFGIAGVVIELFGGDDGVPQQSDQREPDTYLRRLRTADGGDRPMKWLRPTTYMDPSTFRFSVSEDFLRYDRYNQVLYYPDGRVSRFDFVAGFGRVREVVDPFGNQITFARTATSLQVTQTLKGSGSRTVTFTIDPETQQPTSMEFGGRTWLYTQGGPGRRFSSVTPPEGPGWTYRYESDRAELTHVGLPTGGSIDYTYETHQFSRDRQPGVSLLSRVIRTRTTSDRVNGPREWTYTYSEDLSGDKTVVETQDSRSTYVHQFSTLTDGMVFTSRTIEGRDGSTWVVLEEETRDYKGVASVAIPYMLWHKRVTRNGRTYTTTYDYSGQHQADYNRPSAITESGDFEVTRVIEYDHEFPDCFSNQPWFGPCILPPTKKETTREGQGLTVTEFTYDRATGFKSEMVVDGVHHWFVPNEDGSGNIKVVRDGRDNETTTFHTWGVASSITTPNTTITRDVHADSLVWSETKRGSATTFDYDAAFRLKRIAPPAGNTATTEYSADGTWTKVTRGSSFVRTDVDGFGQPIGTINSLGVKTTIRYDSAGRKSFESLPYTATLVGDDIESDALGRITKRRHADQSAVTWEYVSGTDGYDVRITDEKGRVTVQHWKAAGTPDKARLAGVRDADGKEWQYTYHVTGALATVSAPETAGHPDSDVAPRTWVYNSQNQLESETHPESGTTRYTLYDAAGNLKTKIDQAGTTFAYEYDGDNRLIKITATAAAGTQVTTIRYEKNSEKREHVAVQNGASVTFTYDEAGRLKSQNENVHGKDLATVYKYEGDDLDSIKYAGGRTVEYGYNTEGQPIFARDVTQSGREVYYANEITYHPSGAIASYKTPNGLTHTTQFDPNRYWITRVAAAAPGATLLSIDYADYDRAGNVGQITTGRAGASPIVESFTYDALDRLARISAPATYGVAEFAYDVHGNRVSNAYGSYGYFAGTLRLQSQGTASYTYDANGNLKTAPNATYTYRSDNMLSRAETPGRDTRYEYDGEHLRVARTVITPQGQATSLYSYGPAGQLLGEYVEGTGSGVSTAREYVYVGTRLVAEVLPPTGGSSSVSVQLAVTSGDPRGDFIEPATATLTATASTTDGTIQRVEFYDGDTRLGTSLSAPYTVTISGLAGGTHTFVAKAVTSTGRSGRATQIITVKIVGVPVSFTVSPSPAVAGEPAYITVSGRNPCGALQFDFGDGSEIRVLPVEQLPYTTTHTWAENGDYAVTIIGHGNCDGVLTGTVPVRGGNARPVVSLTAPAAGAELVGGTAVALTATASDPDPDGSIVRVDFYAGATLVGSATAPPYTVTWVPDVPGPITIKAVAFDNRGTSAESTRSVTVTHLSGVSVSPTSIQEGMSATVTVSGLASCAAVQIDYGDGVVVTYPLDPTQPALALPLSRAHTWTSAGTRTIVATGQGSCLGSKSTSLSVSGNTPPTVSLTAPTPGASFDAPASIALAATAQDSDGTIARVEFYAGTTLIGTSTSAPFGITWTAAAAGSYALTAKAIDNGGASTVSAAVAITVSDIAAVSVSPSPIQQGQSGTVTVSGNPSCGAVQIDYGDGFVETYALSTLPLTHPHVWSTTGPKTIIATGQGSCIGTRATAVFVNGNAAPTVAITAPANGAAVIVGQTVTITATAQDSDGTIARVEFLDGSTVIATDTSAPYATAWVPTAGPHALTARAVDNANAVTTSAAVNVTGQHLTSVTVSPASPLQGVAATVSVAGGPGCGAVEINYGDGLVEVYPVDTLPISRSHTWETPGARTITATGHASCVGTVSTTITVNANTPPSVSLTSPANGGAYVVGQTITLSANAADSDGSIARVEFLSGGSVIGTDTTPPYSITWAPGAGTFAVSARAVDNGNVSATSATATVTFTHVASVSISPSSIVPNQTATVTVNGSSACGAVTINYGDGTVITYATSLPTSQNHSWPGQGVWTVTATGQGGCAGSASGTVTVVANPAPSVSLTAPASGSVYTTGTAITLSAAASDAHGVARVEFYAGGALVGTDTVAPYQVAWSVASGVVTVFARAYDVYGAYADSAGATVTGRNVDPRMVLDAPANGSTTGQPFLIGGWAIDLGAPAGTGVDAIHVYAAPASGGGWIWLGTAGYGGNRPDIAAAYGEQFRYSGFTMSGSGLGPGGYTIVVYAHSTASGNWDARTAYITIPTPQVTVWLDTPTSGTSVGQPFTMSGWAIDTAHPTESGVSFMHVYAYPADGSAPIFVGTAYTGGSRPDVGAAYGARFTPSGWSLNVSGLAPGWYTFYFYPWSTVTQSFRYEAAFGTPNYIMW